MSFDDSIKKAQQENKKSENKTTSSVPPNRNINLGKGMVSFYERYNVGRRTLESTETIDDSSETLND